MGRQRVKRSESAEDLGKVVHKGALLHKHFRLVRRITDAVVSYLRSCKEPHTAQLRALGVCI